MDKEAMLTLIGPIYLMTLSAAFIPITLFNLVISLNLKPLTSFSSFKDHWFSRFWSFFAPRMQERIGPAVAPLIEHATGTVLDVGSGQGHFLRLYAQSPNRSRITKIYAVEPNKSHHPALLAHAKEAGLADIFEILDSTIETLESRSGIQRHSIDTIVTVQVLCSVNDPEILIRELRTYLKLDGGKWIAFEHVRRSDNGVVAWYQDKLNYVWPTFFNGCSLIRDTSISIQTSGNWDKKKSNGGLKPLETDNDYTALPTVSGVLVSRP